MTEINNSLVDNMVRWATILAHVRNLWSRTYLKVTFLRMMETQYRVTLSDGTQNRITKIGYRLNKLKPCSDYNI